MFLCSLFPFLSFIVIRILTGRLVIIKPAGFDFTFNQEKADDDHVRFFLFLENLNKNYTRKSF
jgi:hypothetical protein